MSNKRGRLFVVATPIGNLDDISARALRVLADVASVAAEDTRHSGRLLAHFNIDTPLVSLHDHNERAKTDVLIERLGQGQDIALVSDAGTPVVSDPGYYLVRQVRAAGFDVIPIPGACAAIAALSASGLASDRFAFEGFPPARASARRDYFAGLAREPRTLVFYESPHRILDSLADMVANFGAAREAVVAREITKRFEDIRSGHLGELVTHYRAHAPQCAGEFVVLIAGQPADTLRDIDVDAARVLDILAAELPVKQAASLAARITGLKKNVLYQRLVAAKGAAPNSE